MPVESSQQRPPARPGSLTNSAYELASSNSTSSHFLGSTQRSWMTGTGGGGRTGSTGARRASQQTVNEPTQIHHSHQSPHVPIGREANMTQGSDSYSDNFTEVTMPARRQTAISLAPSTATSPICIDPLQSNTQAEAIQLLQRTTSIGHEPASETPTRTPTTSIAPVLPPQSSTASVSQATRPSINLPPVQSTPQPDWQTWQTADTLRFSAAIATSPTPNMTSIAHRQPRIVPSPVVAVPNTTQPPSAATQTPAVMTPISAPSLMSRKRPMETQDEDRRTRQRSDDPSVSQIPTPVATPTLPSQTYATQLEQAVAQVRKEHALNRLDDQRLGLLREACDLNDTLYFWIHHVYSLAHVNRKALHDLGFGHPEYIGLGVFEPILMHNSNISFGAITLFINFPQKTATLLEASSANMLANVKGFLSALGLRWTAMCNTCKARGHPPSAIEIIFVFSISSPIMQKTLFNSIHRQVSGADNLNQPFAHNAIMLFLEDQRQALQQRIVLTHDFVVHDGKSFGQRYLQLKASFPQQATLQSQQRRSSAQSPTQSAHAQLPHLVTQQPPGFLPPQPTQPRYRNHAQIPRPSTQAMPQYLARPMPTTMQQIAAQHVAPNGSPYAFMPNQAPMHLNPQMTQQAPINQRRLPQPSTLTSGAQPKKSDDPLLPPPGYPVQFTANANPDRVGLHQAHLRSPMPRKVDIAGIDQPCLRLYQYVKEFVLPPQKIDANTRFIEWHFDLSQAMLMQRAIDIAAPTISYQNMRLFRPGSILFRLKAVSVNAGSSLQDSDFNALSTSWPTCCFVSINDCVDLELRRTQHHGRDLPADLIRVVRPGHNLIQLSNHSLVVEAKKDFYFAVELIHVVDQSEITTMPHHLSFEDSLAVIKSVLASSQDDELSFTDPYVSIDVVDPFMATIWRTPVRGKYCKHRECFDLQAFLLSRTSRVREGPTNPDQWLCPICKKDARPQNLVIDGFLQGVRIKLEERGELDAKAILVGQDGRWEVKVEKDKQSSADAAAHPPVPAAPAAPTAMSTANMMATSATATNEATTRANVDIRQNPELGIDLDGMAALAAYNGANEGKDSILTGASGSATSAAQTPVPPTIIEIEDDD